MPDEVVAVRTHVRVFTEYQHTRSEKRHFRLCTVYLLLKQVIVWRIRQICRASNAQIAIVQGRPTGAAVVLTAIPLQFIV